MLKQRVIITRVDDQFSKWTKGNELKKWEVIHNGRKIEGKCGAPEEVEVIALNILRDVKEPIRNCMRTDRSEPHCGVILDFKPLYLIQDLGQPYESNKTANVKVVTFDDCKRPELMRLCKEKGLKFKNTMTNDEMRKLLITNK